MGCPWETLGVPRDAPPADVKRAYRAAILRAHPDKGGSVERFRAVHQAYEQLRDPADPDPDEPDVLAMLAKVCRDLWVKRQRKALEVRLEAEVSLADVYAGTVKKLQYRVARDGADELHTLLVPLTDFKREVVFPGLGDVSGALRGDLVLTIRVACGAFQLDDVMGLLDLYTEVPVALDTYLLGGTVAVPLPDGTSVQYAAAPLLGKRNNGKKTVTLHGRGLPSSRSDRGDLIVMMFLDVEGVDADALARDPCIRRSLAGALSQQPAHCHEGGHGGAEPQLEPDAVRDGCPEPG